MKKTEMHGACSEPIDEVIDYLQEEYQQPPNLFVAEKSQLVCKYCFLAAQYLVIACG